MRGLLRPTLPLVVVAVLFAALHYRAEPVGYGADQLVHIFIRMAVASLTTLAFGIALLRFRAGATLADLGLDPSRFWSDVRLGLVSFFALAAPLYLLQALLTHLLPFGGQADPITIFLLTLVLGLLYHRTHRIVPSITTHMALNATSVMMAWFLLS